MGRWGGWWEQQTFGRQEMTGLVLDIDPSGAVSGSGTDCIGAFHFRGRFGPRVTLVKQYVGRHALEYDGENTGEGVYGMWRTPGMPPIPGWTMGQFALYPLRGDGAGHGAMREIRPVQEK